jgi:hypothetical protein
MKFRMPGATALAAILVAVAAPAPLALAQNGGQQAPPPISRNMVGPMNEAITAIQAKDWATAQAKITAATPHAKTPVDKAQLERLKLAVAAETKNGPQQVTSINALLASGTLSAEDTKAYKGALAKAHLDSGDPAASLNAFRVFVDEYGGTPEQLVSIANDSLKANDNATAATYGHKAIAASAAAGKTAPDSWYRLVAQAHQRQNQMGEYYAIREQMLIAHPNITNAGQYWKELIVVAQNEPAYGSPARLDLFRTLLGAGVPLTPQERAQAAQIAMDRGLPNEALTLLEGAGDLSEGEKANLASAKSQVTADKAGLAKETADVLAKGDGAAIASIGEAQLSYGDYPKAVEVLKAAVAKGIPDAGELAIAKLHLGIAQYRAGDKASAQATWAEVKEPNGANVLAKNWTLISKVK